METIQSIWSQFMDMTCPVWIPAAAGLGVLLILVVPLAKTIGKWKKKYNDALVQAEENSRSQQEKAEKDIASAAEASQKEIARIQLEAERDVADARKEANRVSQEADQKIEDIIRTSELEVMAEKERSERAIHEERETIRASETELAQADEKELLVRIVMALSGYGTRLDRLEKSVSEIMKRTKYQTGSGFSGGTEGLLSGGQSCTPVLDHLCQELNSMSKKQS